MASKARRMAGTQSFTVVTSTGGSKTATFTNSFPAGIYTIESLAGDADLEIYLGAEDGTNVGYVTGGSKAITASAPFKYVTTANANSSDAIIFSLYPALTNATTLATKTDAYWAPPTITAVSPASLFNQNSTTTITGTNFASNAAVQFRKSDDATLVSAKQIVVGSNTSIIATRPDSFSPTDAPYDVIVTNATTGLSGISLNAVTAGSAPAWSTSATLPAFQKTVAYSQAVVATDADTSPTVTYSQVSATLPTGITFSNGTFSGTPSTNGGSYNAVIRATDLGGNYADRTFTLAQDKPDAPGIGVATATEWNTATVAFTAPAYTGTSTITSYTATSSPGGFTGTLSQAGSGTITVTGLSETTAYTFTVTATNSSGTSVVSSASSSVTTPAFAVYADILVVAGGGGGGGSVRNLSSRNPSGGGGAGGYLEQSQRTLVPSTTYSISIGGGGAGTASGSPGNGTRAGFGTNTTFGAITALGGGGAGNGDLSSGGNGGSGGGSTDGAAAGSATQGNSDGATGYGNAGGIGATGAGGGGAGGAGQNTGPGGLGKIWSGNSTAYAGGGGGGGIYNGAGGAGGSSIGGNGGSGLNASGTSGAVNTGSGGGGQGSAPGTTTSGVGGNGAGGIVIIKTLSTASSATVSPTTSGSYKIYTFTGSGTITF